MKLVFALVMILIASSGLAACHTPVMEDTAYGQVHYRVATLDTTPEQFQLDVIKGEGEILDSFRGYPIKFRQYADTRYWNAEKVYKLVSGQHVPAEEAYIELQKLAGMRGYIVLFKSEGRYLNSRICL